jgi:hypothetical protein
MLALPFVDKDDYAKIHEDDKFDITGPTSFEKDQPLKIVVHQAVLGIFRVEISFVGYVLSLKNLLHNMLSHNVQGF